MEIIKDYDSLNVKINPCTKIRAMLTFRSEQISLLLKVF